MERYIKHINFDAIGIEGQKKLLSSSVLIVGAGGLGTNFANHFVRAGIGKVSIIDNDKVELSNLQRQLFYDERDIGKFKAEVLAEKLGFVNSEIKINGIVDKLNKSNIDELLSGVDILVDATDNFETRFIIDEACRKHGVPWLFTGIIGANAQSILINPSGRSLEELLGIFGIKNSNKLKASGLVEPDNLSYVLAPAVSMIASFASVLLLKFLLESDIALVNKLFILDAWNGSFRSLKL
jgi:molybdopterin-synthase adenylyltransferase